MNIFKVATIEHSGDNWLIADFGVDSQDNQHYILTTDDIPASRLCQYSNGAKADAERICRLLNLVVHDTEGQRRWSWWRYHEQVQRRRKEGGIHGFSEADVQATYEHMAAADMSDDYEAALAELRAENTELRAKLEDLFAKYEASQNELHNLRIKSGPEVKA